MGKEKEKEEIKSTTRSVRRDTTRASRMGQSIYRPAHRYQPRERNRNVAGGVGLHHAAS